MEQRLVGALRGQAAFALACLIAGLAAGLLSLLVSDAWNAGFSGADEPAHFLNTYFIAEYAKNALGSNPLAFASEYYLHYPKISIGHWPPAYYALLSPFFLLLPASPHSAFVLNLILSAVPAMLIGLLLARLHGRAAGLLGALAAALTPVALEAQAFFMLDQAVAAFALGATMLWIAYATRPAAWKMLGFAILAATAVLIKGNGWLLLFVPPIHLALTGGWRLLLSPWPWAAALLAALLVGPWYWLTAGISADGFNHSPGLAYAWEALRYNAGALAANVTIPGLALAAWGAAAEWRRRHEAPERWTIAAGCVSLALAALLLQSLVPVDLDPRYMAPAIPPIVLLALSGAAALLPRHRIVAVVAAAILLSLPGLLHLATREPKAGFRLEEAAARVPHPSAWVIDGTSGAEGAFVAAMAVRDPSLGSYAIRSSRLLAESNFMGTEYRLIVSEPSAVLARLEALGVEGIVISRAGGEAAFPHSDLLRSAIAGPGSPYRLAARLAHRNRPGVTEIYERPGRVAMNEPALRALGLPGKAAGLTAQ
jgi:4-amino-4-deoxy-L-arabinose transferase-like glycosyltransferase